MYASSAGGDYNFGVGVTATSTDRALGFLTNSSSVGSPRHILLQIKNSTGATIKDLKVDFAIEKYRNGTNSFAWQFYSSTDGSAWVENSNGGQSFPAGTANTVVEPTDPSFSTPKSVTLTNVNLAADGVLYLRWSHTGGPANGQALGLDNLVLTPTLSTGGNPTPVSTIITTTPATAGSYCVTTTAGSTPFNVAFTTTGTFTGTFRAQLSNASGSFASGTTLIGEGASSPIAAVIPANTASGTGYRVRVINEATVINGSDNGSNLAVNLASTTTAVTVTPAAAQTIALTGTGTTLTATATTSSTFTWTYATSAAGPFTSAIASASGASYQPKGSDFGAAGTYYVVANATAATTCGSANGQSAPVAITVSAPRPEVITSLPTVPDFGSTVAGAASTAKSFTVSGTGLTSALIITPPAGFEIRTGAQPFACCAIQLQPSNGTVNATTVDVRFAPTAAQSYQAAIPVTSSGLSEKLVAVSGTSTAPVYPATVSTTSLSNITTTGATTGGTIEPDGGSPVTVRGVLWAKTPNPVLGTAQTADGAGSGPFTSSITGLVPGATYYVRAYATNSAGTAYGEELSLTTVAVPLAAEPTQSATLVDSQVTSTSMQLILNGGNGAKHLVVAHLGSAVDAAPVDATTYADSTIFGKGARIGTGNYVVYAGSRDTLVVSGLRPNTSYSFMVFEYSDNNTPYAENYLTTSPGTLTKSTLALPTALLLEENFDYTAGAALTANNWTAHSSGGTNSVTVTASSLKYDSYGASNIGNAATLKTSGEDLNRKFATLYAGTPVYASFLVNVESAKAAGDYFFHLGTSTTNSSYYKGRVFVRSSGTSAIQFGVSNNSDDSVRYVTTTYELGKTYLLVVKYVFDENGGTTQLFINPALATEPATADATSTENTGSPSDIGSVALRQGDKNNAAGLTVDGIRVGNTYRVVRTGIICLQPAPAFAANTVCVGSATVFTNTSTTVEDNATYAWDVDNDGTVDYTTKGNITHAYTEPGTYTAKLTITQGTCSDTYTQQVTVRALPTATLSGAATICAGTSTKLALRLTGVAPWTVNYSADGGATATVLTINADEVSTTGDYQLTVSPTATTTYTLTAVSDANCTGLVPTGSATVTVNTKPVLTLPTIAATYATAGLRGASVAFAATATGSTPAPGLTYSIVKNNVVTLITSPYVFPLGTTTVTATATNDCGSTVGTFTVTVQSPDFVSVLHQNADLGQTANNAIKPNLQLVNNSTAAISYQELTVRYWLTVEDYAAIATAIDYAQLGTGAVKAKYVALTEPVQGALGYVEYSFTAAAGKLSAGANSGAIQSRINKTSWTNFNELDDYSYAANGSYLKNERITVYRNGELVGGIEPALVPASAPKLVVLSQNKEKKTTTNSLSTFLQVRNDGYTPVAYKDLTVRYWFSPDGTSPLNSYVDYAQLGNNNVSISFGKSGTETYAELHFAAGLGTFSPLSNTGNVQYRIAKSDWSNFNQANDFSYLPAADVFAENAHITAYVNGTLVYGQEPMSATRSTAAALGTDSGTSAKATVSSYPNPFSGSTTIAFTAAHSQDYQLEIYDISGRLVRKLQAGKAQAGQLVEVEWQAGNTPAGLYLARLTTGTTVQQVKLVLQ
ncbi:hypothetical protein GCM10011383_26210 [Hymenobacter cavernae]|uniref:T9SS C-terminal target domain-containing protein n=2 Tax=Hymenobacter cavernae TaxID=2044852 RepID=A0ABQ1UDJ4_9BACT|nr:hypothetical protein GCM10011383_26210 [Hymenobacter cavernae]